MLSVPLFVTMLAMAPVVMLRDKVRQAVLPPGAAGGAVCCCLTQHASHDDGITQELWRTSMATSYAYVRALLLADLYAPVISGRRLWQHEVNNIWARASTTPWYSVEVIVQCSAVLIQAGPRKGL